MYKRTKWDKLPRDRALAALMLLERVGVPILDLQMRRLSPHVSTRDADSIVRIARSRARPRGYLLREQPKLRIFSLSRDPTYSRRDTSV